MSSFRQPETLCVSSINCFFKYFQNAFFLGLFPDIEINWTERLVFVRGRCASDPGMGLSIPGRHGGARWTRVGGAASSTGYCCKKKVKYSHPRRKNDRSQVILKEMSDFIICPDHKIDFREENSCEA